jgi:hypothetical protein
MSSARQDAGGIGVLLRTVPRLGVESPVRGAKHILNELRDRFPKGDKLVNETETDQRSEESVRKRYQQLLWRQNDTRRVEIEKDIT